MNTDAEVVITARYDDQAGAGLERLRSDMAALNESARSFAEHEESLNRTIESLETFRERYVGVMNELGDVTRTALEGYVAGSYMAVAKAMAVWINGANGAARQFTKAMLELSAGAVLAIGRQAAVKSLFALAEFFLFKDPMALKAAQLYGVVAGMALAAGASMMAAANNRGGGGSGGDGGGSGGSGWARGRSRSRREVEQGMVVNVNVQGHVVDSRAFVEEVVAPALADAVGRGAGGSARYNLVAERD